MKIDLHTHTIASGHGTTDTLTDLAKEASSRLITVLGISDHAPAMMDAAKESYFRGLTESPKERFGVRMLYGAELNILDQRGRVDLPSELIARLDYCIVSLHAPLFPSGTPSENTDAYYYALEHVPCGIIGHPDDARFPIVPLSLVHAAKSRHALIELNNASLSPNGYRGDCASIDRSILNACISCWIPVIIGSDSHGRFGIGDETWARRLLAQTQFPPELIANDQPALLREYFKL